MFKNQLQELAQRSGFNLPSYKCVGEGPDHAPRFNGEVFESPNYSTTVRSGPDHVPVFTSNVELAGMRFSGAAPKTKKQAEKNAVIAAWSALKQVPILWENVTHGSSEGCSREVETGEKPSEGYSREVETGEKPSQEQEILVDEQPRRPQRNKKKPARYA